jgi:hypothetical protein
MEDIPITDIPAIKAWIDRFPHAEKFLIGITASIPEELRSVRKSDIECLACIDIDEFHSGITFKGDKTPPENHEYIPFVKYSNTVTTFAIAVLTNIGDKLSEFAKIAIFYAHSRGHYTNVDFWIAIAASCAEYDKVIPTELLPIDEVPEDSHDLKVLLGFAGLQQISPNNAKLTFTIMENEERGNVYLSFLRSNNYFPSNATIAGYLGIYTKPTEAFWKGLVMSCYL